MNLADSERVPLVGFRDVSIDSRKHGEFLGQLSYSKHAR
jgi:hypothetical protein